MTAGRGFMGFAAVIFGAGHPIGSAAAALFFAIVGAIGIRAQLIFGDQVPHDLLLALPYLATVFGVWISGRLRGGAKAPTASANCATTRHSGRDHAIRPAPRHQRRLHPVHDLERRSASIRKAWASIRAPGAGFRRFFRRGLTLALWERGHIGAHADVPRHRRRARRRAIAVRLDSVAAIDFCL